MATEIERVAARDVCDVCGRATSPRRPAVRMPLFGGSAEMVGCGWCLSRIAITATGEFFTAGPTAVDARGQIGRCRCCGRNERELLQLFDLPSRRSRPLPSGVKLCRACIAAALELAPAAHWGDPRPHLFPKEPLDAVYTPRHIVRRAIHREEEDFGEGNRPTPSSSR